MIRKFILPFLALTLLVWAAGCSDNSSTEPEVSDQTNLDAEFGGYTTASESPAFGDTELLATEGDEVEVTDALASSPEIVSIIDEPTSGRFHFRAVWGQLSYDSSHTTATDWTGSLEISRGGVLIRRTVCFELAQDYIVPRIERTLLEWVSVTTVHKDGIVAEIIIPQLFPTIDTTVEFVVDSLGDTSEVYIVDTIPADDTPVELTFTTGPYTRTFTLAELASLDEVVDLDDGNQIAFSSFQRFRCPKGMLSGYWGYDEEGNGAFRGMWIDRGGFMAGWLQGDWGTNEAGEQVFFGKWINLNGQFEGFLSGTWQNNPSTNASENAQGRAGGKFEGKIYNADRTEIGELAGHYKSARQYRAGYFQGRWKLDCTTDDTDDPAVELNDGF